jgi:beta-lactamase superfamily II metal-dependent hydrolase
VSRIACLLALFTASLTAAPNLELYFIDVEGGKSVLLVSPSGQSMLFDVGWPASNNRPASTERIVEAVQAAGLDRVDFLVISHFDVDHMGDVRRSNASHLTQHCAKRSATRFSRWETKSRLEA